MGNITGLVPGTNGLGLSESGRKSEIETCSGVAPLQPPLDEVGRVSRKAVFISSD